MLATMEEPKRYTTDWEGLRLIVEAEPDHVQAFVYDPTECDILYSAARTNIESAKVAVIDFVATSVFGSQHGLEPTTIAEMLVWEPET